jgi:hypothetical protein
MSTDVSEEHIASIFRIEYIEQGTSVKAGGKQIFDPEDGGDMFLRNVG